jgi:hypothetical protein
MAAEYRVDFMPRWSGKPFNVFVVRKQHKHVYPWCFACTLNLENKESIIQLNKK